MRLKIETHNHHQQVYIYIITRFTHFERKGKLPLDVIVTKVSQDERLDNFCYESRQVPKVPAASQKKILPIGLVSLHVDAKNV